MLDAACLGSLTAGVLVGVASAGCCVAAGVVRVGSLLLVVLTGTGAAAAGLTVLLLLFVLVVFMRKLAGISAGSWSMGAGAAASVVATVPGSAGPGSGSDMPAWRHCWRHTSIQVTQKATTRTRMWLESSLLRACWVLGCWCSLKSGQRGRLSRAKHSYTRLHCRWYCWSGCTARCCYVVNCIPIYDYSGLETCCKPAHSHCSVSYCGLIRLPHAQSQKQHPCNGLPVCVRTTGSCHLLLSPDLLCMAVAAAQQLRRGVPVACTPKAASLHWRTANVLELYACRQDSSNI